MEALRRQISTGTYNQGEPLVVPERDDKRYRAWETENLPEANAVVV
jgi:hypothetical protein